MKRKNESIVTIDCCRFIKVPKRKQLFLVKVLKCCKEIRNTIYPIKGDNPCFVKCVDCLAQKDSDVYSIVGMLILSNGKLEEIRNFEAYVMEDVCNIKVYMDIERCGVEDEPKHIRISENIEELDESFFVTTMYSQSDFTQEKSFSEKVNKVDL